MLYGGGAGAALELVFAPSVIMQILDSVFMQGCLGLSRSAKLLHLGQHHDRLPLLVYFDSSWRRSSNIFHHVLVS